MAIFLKRNGAWQKIEEPYIKRNGNWILPEEGYIKENGQWKLIFEQFEFEVETVSASEDINTATFTGQLTAFEDFEESNFLQTTLTDATSSPGVAVDGDRQKVAVGGGDDTVYVYDRDFNLEDTLSDPANRVLSCSYNTNNGRLAAGSADMSVYVYDSDGNLEATLTDPGGEVNDVVFNESNGRLAVGSEDNQVYLYDSNLQLTNTITQFSNPVKSLDWRESDNYLFISANPGAVTVLDTSFNSVDTLTDASGETRVAVGDNDRIAVLNSQKIYIYTNNFSLTSELTEFDETASGDLGDVAWDDNGRVAHASRDSKVYIYNSSYNNIATIDDSGRRFSKMDWSGQNDILAAGADEGGQGDTYVISTGVSVFFEYGQQGQGLSNRVRAGGRTALGQFSTDIDGLQPLTSYEMRAGGETSEGREAFGDTILFTTSDTVLQVDTLSATNVFTTTADLRGEITAFDGFNQDANIRFDWGEQSVGPVNTLNAGTQSGTGFFQEELTGLTDGETYVFEAVASAGSKVERGGEVTFSTTAIQLNTNTLGASGVQAQTATLNGELTAFSGFTQDATVEFEWGEQGSGFPNTTTADQSPLSSTGTFSAVIGDDQGEPVDPATQYEYRAVAEAEGVVDTGGFVNFTTQSTTLTVQTDAASNISFDSAQLNGTLTAFDGFVQGTTANVKFEWGQQGQPLSNVENAGNLSSTSPFSSTLTGLQNGTTYEYKAIAEAGNKTREGSVVSFDTVDVIIDVTTDPESNVTQTSAQLNGTLNQLQGTSSTTANFAWGQVGQGTPNTTTNQTLSSTGSYSASLSGLQQDTDYEYKAQAGSEEGNLVQFSTSQFVIQIDSATYSYTAGDQVTFGESENVSVTVSGTGGLDFDYEVREIVNGTSQGTVADVSNQSSTTFTANWNVGDSANTNESDFDQGNTIAYEVVVTDVNNNTDSDQSSDVTYQEAPAINVPNSKSFFAQSGNQQTRAIDITEESGKEDLTIDSTNTQIVGSDPGEFTFSNLPGTIPAGTTESVDVTYSPTAVETDDAVFEVAHDGRNISSPVNITLDGSAQEVPLISVTPTSQDFGQVAVGNTPTRQFTVSEDGGDSNLVISSTTLSGDGEFSITSDIPDNTTISAGGSDTLTVEYAPNQGGESNSATLTINSDADNNGSLEVSLDGQGKFVPAIDLNPDGTQDFGTISTDQTDTITFTINETSGDQGLTISNIQTTGTNAGDFDLGSNVSTIESNGVPAGGSESFDVTFDPTANGARNATLEIEHDGQNISSPISRSLEGDATTASTIGTAPAEGDTLDFGSIIEDESTSDTITIQETGGANSFTIDNINASGNAFNLLSSGSIDPVGNSGPFTIPAGGSETVGVEFDPTSDGNFTNQFTFDHTAAEGDVDTSVTIDLTATAQSVSTISTSPVDGGTLVLSATSGNSDQADITISEVGGGESFDVTGLNLTDNSSEGNAFSIQSSPGNNFTVNPSTSETVTIAYNPTDTTSDTGSLDITHNANDGPTSPVQIDISGSATAPATFDISATTLNFNDRLVSNSDSISVSISETGGDSGFNITNQSITSNSSDFNITNSASSSVSASGSTTATVEFAPTSVSGNSENVSGTFTIEHDAPQGNSSPVDVSLNGTALKQATAALSTGSISFGNVIEGNSATDSFQIQETAGNEDYTITGFNLTGDTTEFDNQPSPQGIFAGSSETVTSEFTPSSGNNTNFNATLEISHDAANGPDPLTLDLSGTGITQVTAAVSPQSIDFGTVFADANTQTESFTLSETSGNGGYTITSTTVTGDATSEYGLQNVPNSISSGGSDSSGEVVFGPLDSGTQTATAEISHDAPGGDDPLTIDLTADVEVKSTISLSTTSLSFPDTIVGNSSSSQSFTVSETGGDNSFTTSNDGIAAQTSTATDQFNTTNSVSSSISAGGSDTVSIEFTPDSTTGGSWNATYRFDNTAQLGSESGTATIDLSGTALADANITGTPSDGSDINFADTTVGQTTTKTDVIELTETGGDTSGSYTTNISGGPFSLAQGDEQDQIGSGGSKFITVNFSPGSTGTFNETLTINWSGQNSSGTITYNLNGTAVQEPTLSITPDPLDFGDVDTNSSAQGAFTFSETTGNDSIDVQNDFQDLDQDIFVPTQQGDSNFTISAGGSVTVEIEFTPDAVTSFSDSFGVQWSSPAFSGSKSDTANLQGTGVDSNAPGISVSTSQLQIGPVDADTGSATATFDITETSGNQDLNISSMTISNPDPLVGEPGEFSYTTGSDLDGAGGTVSAGQTATIEVEFNPSDDGFSQAEIDIEHNSNDGTSSPVTVDLDGDTFPEVESVTWGFTDGTTVGGGDQLSFDSFTTSGIAPSGETFEYDVQEENITQGGSGSVFGGNRSVNGSNNIPSNVTWNVGDSGISIADGDNIEYRVEVQKQVFGTPFGDQSAPQGVDIGSASLTFVSGDISFGEVDSGSSIATLENDGSLEVINLSDSITGTDSTEFTSSGFGDQAGDRTIAPGNQKDLTVDYDPDSQTSDSATLEVTGSNNTSASISLSGQGRSTALLEITPTSETFDEFEQKSFTVNNNTSNDLTMSENVPSEWSLDNATYDGVRGGDTLSAGGSGSVTIQYLPSSGATDSGTLTVSADSGLSANADLTGNGGNPSVAVTSSTPVDFGTGSGTETITLENGGVADTSSVSTSGLSSPFSVSNQPSDTIAANGGTTTIDVDYNPSSTNTASDTLNIDIDNGDQTLTVDVSGDGQGTASVSITPDDGTTDFGTGNSNETFSITNNGDVDLTGLQVDIVGTDSEEWSVSSGPFSTSLSPSQTTDVNIDYTPSTTDADNGSIEVNADQQSVPVGIKPISGQGQASTDTDTDTDGGDATLQATDIDPQDYTPPEERDDDSDGDTEDQ